jgi:hypothetical protein
VPALDAEGGALTFMVISLDATQPASVMVQRKVFKPVESPVTLVPGFEGELTEAPPAITLQVPKVPDAGVLPARVAEVILQKL